MNIITYINRNNVQFEIEYQTADVPKDADYFGYYIQVTVDDVQKMQFSYRAYVSKTVCTTEAGARQWLDTTGRDFLEAILDTYENGKTLILLPPDPFKWCIL